MHQKLGKAGKATSLVCSALLFISVATPSRADTDTARSVSALVDRFHLANGLDVILAPDEQSESVVVVVRYRVGQAYDPRAYRGLSHLLEHLTFRGSRHLRPLQGAAILGSLGAGFNARTELEQTVYYTVGRPAGLETVLWIESERMGFALDGIDEASLRVEQRIVGNELRERNGGLMRLIEQRSFAALYGPDHPFAPAEDEVADVEAVELPGLQWFFQSTYRPDNATLVVTGNFDTAQARHLVARYFGAIKQPSVPRLSVSAPPPQLCGLHRLRLGHHFLFGRRMSFTWQAPSARSPGASIGLAAMSVVLESRLRSKLVQEGIDAAAVDVVVNDFQTHSLLSVNVDMLDQGSWETVQGVVLGEARRLAGQPVVGQELRSLRARLISDEIFSREDDLQRAVALAYGRDVDAERIAAYSLDANQVLEAARPLTGPLLVVQAEPSSEQAGPVMRIQSEQNPCR